MAIIPAASVLYISHDIPIRFRQNSHYAYLTGCHEEDGIFTVEVDEARKVKTTLFVLPRVAHRETWDGERWGAQRAKEMFPVDQAFELR